MRSATFSFGWEDPEFGPLLVHYEYEPGEPQTWHHPGCGPTAVAYLCQLDDNDLTKLGEVKLGAMSKPWAVYVGDFCPVGSFQEECDAAAYEDACKMEEDGDDDYDRREYTEPWY